MPTIRCIRSAALLALVCSAYGVRADDSQGLRVRFVDEQSTEREFEGQLLVEAADGGLLVEDRAGELWSITPDRLASKETLESVPEPFSADELAAHVTQLLGRECEVVTTNHYVIVTTSNEKYAEWVGNLFERLLRAFLSDWRRGGWELSEPAAPLSAIVFASQAEFDEFARLDAGPQLVGKLGYYSVRTNRIALYDLADSQRQPVRSEADVNRRVAAAPANVATIVHEATHQLAFNCGMQTRYADNPMWLSEGIAMYCETPDLRTGSGWGTIGRVNTTRLAHFREFARARRPDDSLSTLIGNEDRFREPASSGEAYAESWALCHFLIRTHRPEFIEYLQGISQKPRLQWDDADARRREFEAAFGPLGDVEQEFLRYVARLGRR